MEQVFHYSLKKCLYINSNEFNYLPDPNFQKVNRVFKMLRLIKYFLCLISKSRQKKDIIKVTNSINVTADFLLDYWYFNAL